MVWNYWKKNARRNLGKTIAGTVLLSLLCCFELASGTTYNSNGSSADVQVKINLAANGDTVTLPSGSFTWTSGVTCSKGLTISGAGGGRVEGTSTSSVTIGSGTKTFTIRSGSTINDFKVGETVTAHVKYYSTKSMTGTVTSWNGTTLV